MKNLFKEIVHWLVFIAVVLMVIGFLTGNPTMPESFDMGR